MDEIFGRKICAAQSCGRRGLLVEEHGGTCRSHEYVLVYAANSEIWKGPKSCPT